jgi:hypothetical protein
MDPSSLPSPQPHPHPPRISSAPSLRRDFASRGGETTRRRPAEEIQYSGQDTGPSFVHSREQIREDLQRVRAGRGALGSGSGRPRDDTLRRGRSEEHVMSGVPPGTEQSKTWMEFLRAGPNHGAGSGSHSRSTSTESRRTNHFAKREAARRRPANGASGPRNQVGHKYSRVAVVRLLNRETARHRKHRSRPGFLSRTTNHGCSSSPSLPSSSSSSSAAASTEA